MSEDFSFLVEQWCGDSMDTCVSKGRADITVKGTQKVMDILTQFRGENGVGWDAWSTHQLLVVVRRGGAVVGRTPLDPNKTIYQTGLKSGEKMFLYPKFS